MFTSHSVRRSSPLAVIILAVALLALLASAANAASFGELTKFGSKGTGNGQFIQHVSTTAFGVDPTDNTVYVGDEPEAKTFRIQKFSATGEFIASTSFHLKGSAEEVEGGIEGIAVDPEGKRIYVLALQVRGPEENAKGELNPDPETEAASALYSFSTVQSGTKLEPATGTVEEGKLAGASVFHPQSKNLGNPAASAMLKPSGIAFDPNKKEVIVMGREDRGPLGEPLLRVSLERITTAGAFTSRYTDTAGFFGEEPLSDSPVVTPAGNILVVGGPIETPGEEGVIEQIDQIPSNFVGEAKPFIRFKSGPTELATFPGEPAPVRGSAMTLAPDGTLWVDARIQGQVEGLPAIAPGALAFSSSTGAELGWTGGQTVTSGLGKCTIGVKNAPMVGAGSGTLFMFDPTETLPEVVAFGPGGSGCPSAKSSGLAITRSGKPVEGTVPPGTQVKLSSTLIDANALSVTWNFGDGSTESSKENEFLTPESPLHTYASEGEYKVTATIHSDNLTTPELVIERTLVVEKPRPVAKFKYAPEVGVGVADAFDGRSSTPSEGATITKYSWEFGDGAKAEGATPEHAYGAPGNYAVKLVVSDSAGLSSKVVEHTVTVPSPPPPPPPPSTTGSVVPPPPPPPPPGGGVLAYTASFSGTSLTVTKAGVVLIKVRCGGPSSCAGTVTLRTLNAVSAAKRKAILVLASGAVTLAGGQTKAVTLHLSAKARALLARLHLLKASATFVAHDQQNQPQTTKATVTLRLLKAKHH